MCLLPGPTVACPLPLLRQRSFASRRWSSGGFGVDGVGDRGVAGVCCRNRRNRHCCRLAHFGCCIAVDVMKGTLFSRRIFGDFVHIVTACCPNYAVSRCSLCSCCLRSLVAGIARQTCCMRSCRIRGLNLFKTPVVSLKQGETYGFLPVS